MYGGGDETATTAGRRALWMGGVAGLTMPDDLWPYGGSRRRTAPALPRWLPATTRYGLGFRVKVWVAGGRAGDDPGPGRRRGATTTTTTDERTTGDERRAMTTTIGEATMGRWVGMTTMATNDDGRV